MAAIDAATSTGCPRPHSSRLNQRATEANRPDGVLEDPMAIVLRDSLDYDYHHLWPHASGYCTAGVDIRHGVQ
ncbi:O-methyltransferase family protein [Mycobacteroides abscessus]|uniref:hypothetical protein n=1 Tax=Mycobacteroides abscessus TaxID=36809 RepID=UPI00044787E8|nr:O-methyltransferase family protein [Mycobacteroides abscessus]